LTLTAHTLINLYHIAPYGSETAGNIFQPFDKEGFALVYDVHNLTSYLFWHSLQETCITQKTDALYSIGVFFYCRYAGTL
jgi:hypothetical protein